MPPDSEVEVRRSKRRRRTVSAYREGDRIIVLIPASLTRRQEAEWVDYHGPVDGERVGIAIFADPRSKYGVPRWHVRSYGLHAANPFGKAPYTGKPEDQGGFTVPAGEAVD